MRKILKNKPARASQVVQIAQALRRRRALPGGRKEFEQAMAYLKKYRRWMDYHGYRRVALPIGSGVTEAACKTIFDYRFSVIDSSSRACGGTVRRDSTCSTCGSC